MLIEECEKLLEVEKINKQQNKCNWKKRMENLSTNWESCRQNIFDTVLSSAAANIDTCSRCLVNKCVIYCQECPDPKSLCSACDEEVHQKYPLHDRDGIYNGYYKALPPKLSVTCDGQHKTISMYPTLYCVTLVYNRLHGKHGVGVPESEPRSRSPGVGVPESDVIKIWKTRSHMENTESDVREKYGKHGVIWKTRSLTS